jgi:hypothetical protein
LSFATAALIVDLTVVNLLVFYQDQSKALIGTALQYIVLIAAFSYRRIYAEADEDETNTTEAVMAFPNDIAEPEPIAPVAL